MSMLYSSCAYAFPCHFSALVQKQISSVKVIGSLQIQFLKYRSPRKKTEKYAVSSQKERKNDPCSVAPPFLLFLLLTCCCRRCLPLSVQFLITINHF